jgi:hypothetical protein
MEIDLTNKEKYELSIPKPCNTIIFCLNDTWIMQIKDGEGIKFNREEFPNYDIHDFANDVIEILEKKFTVKFDKKTPPYDL